MLYVRKTLTKREREDYRKWLEKHASKPLTKQRQVEITAELWKNQNANYQLRTEGRSTAHFPSVGLSKPEPVQPNPLAQMDHDQREEYLKREAAAQELIREKMNRTGPAYNKGGDVYYSDGMLESMKQGSHRRR